MGAQCSSEPKDRCRISFVDVDKEGRLNMLKHSKLSLGQVAKMVPRIALWVEEISTVLRDEDNWYDGGRSMQRALYHYFYETTDGLVYVIDSNNVEELDAALDKLDRQILKDDDTQTKVIMILANRQGEEGALPLEKIENKVKEKLDAHEPTLGGRCLFLKGCNSKTQMGVEDALSWLIQVMQKQRKGELTPGYHSLLENDASGKEEKNQSLLHSLKKVFHVSSMKSILLH